MDTTRIILGGLSLTISAWLFYTSLPYSGSFFSQDSVGGIEVNDATLFSLVANSPTVLVMFYADWCGYCRAFMPTFEKASKDARIKAAGTKLVRINCPKNPISSSTYNIDSYPTFKYFKNGKVEDGIKRDEYEGFVRSIIKQQK